MFFPRGEKAVEGKRVLAHMRVDQHGDFGVEIAERGKRGEKARLRDSQPGDVENNLDWSFFQQAAAEQSDHRMQVLPRWAQRCQRGKEKGRFLHAESRFSCRNISGRGARLK